MPRLSSKLRVLSCCLAFGLSGAIGAFQGSAPPSEDKVKAAIVVQLARFVEWPPGAAPDFDLCVLGKDRWMPLLEEAARGQLIWGKPLRVRRLARAKDALACQIVVIGLRAAERPWTSWGHAPILTVSDEPGFAAAGGMVGLTVQSGKVAFELNPKAAAQCGLHFSSKLIRLARLVGEN